MNRKTVISAHIAIYTDPIIVRKGDVLLLGKLDIWDGHTWIWATSKEMKCGWVPDNLACEKGGKMVAGYDYSAVEISCNSGDIVDVTHEDHGWAWCNTENNEEGWIPLRNLGSSPT